MCPRLEPVWNCGRPIKYQTSLRCCYQGMRPCVGSAKFPGDRRLPSVFNSSLPDQKLPLDSESDIQGSLVRQKRFPRCGIETFSRVTLSVWSLHLSTNLRRTSSNSPAPIPLIKVSMIAGSSARDRAAISTVRPAEPRRMSLSGNFKRQTRGAPRRDRKDEPFVVGAE